MVQWITLKTKHYGTSRKSRLSAFKVLVGSYQCRQGQLSQTCWWISLENPQKKLCCQIRLFAHQTQEGPKALSFPYGSLNSISETELLPEDPEDRRRPLDYSQA